MFQADYGASIVTMVLTNPPWNRISVEMLSQFEDGCVVYLQQDEILSLFGEEYSLGSIKPIVLPAKLVNGLEVKALLDQGFCGELPLRFVPSGDGAFTKEYVKWLPCAD